MLDPRPRRIDRRLNLARVGICIGVTLCGLSLVAMVQAPAKTSTQFVPMMAGIPLLFFGVTGLNPHRRRVSVWLSIGVAATAVIYDGARFLQLLRLDGPMATFDERVVSVMAILAIIYLAFAAAGWAWHQRSSPR